MLVENVDFGRTSRDYGTHRAGFPPETFERLSGRGIGLPGQKIVDLGTGTGTVARQLAARGAKVTALDVSAAQIEEARRLAEEENLEIEFLEGRAESTGLAGGVYDVVVAGQCWHWFDRAEAAAEVHRLLKPGGHVVIAHFDWLPLPGNVVEMTEMLIMRANPDWSMGGGTGLYPAWFADLSNAGFSDLESFSFDVTVPYSHEDWRGRIRASAGIAASLPKEEVSVFDRGLAGNLKAKFPRDPLAVPHRVWAVVGER